MKPDQFEKLIKNHGVIEKYSGGKVFHSQDFAKKRLFFVIKGYVKRYQARNPENKVLELIYGPGHIISLSQLYKTLSQVDQNQDKFIYIYQAMTDIELSAVDSEIVLKELETNPLLYRDFFYESGLKLRSNIFRLASNSIKDDYQKVAHQLVSLAYEFGAIIEGEVLTEVVLPLPQSAVDIAEQLNISKQVVEAVLNNLSQNKIIKINGNQITILNMELLKDVYL